MTGLHTTHAPAEAATTWQPPAGIAPRGTLVVLPGRGEHGLVYERFGRRLAADGYVVHALDTTPDLTAEEVSAAVTTAAGTAPTTPLVLVGSDTGALQALHAAAGKGHYGLPLAGVVLTGIATTEVTARTEVSGDLTGGDVRGAVEVDVQEADGWDAELAARTSCPTHRARLTDDQAIVRGALATPAPAHLTAEAVTDLPALLLHGAADPVTPLDRARALAARLPRAAFGVLHEGVHDVLNDASHRSTAATVVLWLERLRTGAEPHPVLTIEDPIGRTAA
ncbi:alpha/beta hydrolase [Streptomyces sp. NPDC050315]|uniref:alpha/beta hydrolase n=1 Tax=Streptomyces sp. NPDC050315 TaxID=3155039 RepID=UPI00343EF36C